MMNRELAAFRTVDFDWVHPLQSIWRDSAFNVEALHHEVVEDVMEDFDKLDTIDKAARIGRVIVGAPGAGKTHLISNLRRQVWAAGGRFILIDIVGIKDFWSTAALGFINSLCQVMPSGRPQYEVVCADALRVAPYEKIKHLADEMNRSAETIVEMADVYVRMLSHAFRHDAVGNLEVARALFLLQDPQNRDAAYSWLQGLSLDDDRYSALGFKQLPPSPAELVRSMAWLMRFGDPTMIAVDQIDSIIAESNLIAGLAQEPGDENERRARSIIETLAGGLMDLKDVASRSITVVTCLAETWSIIERKAQQAAAQRFVPAVDLHPVRSAALIADLLTQRLTPAYERLGFAPPYPTWPFAAAAIRSVENLSPRQILMRCDAFQRYCRGTGIVRECTSLVDAGAKEDTERPKRDLDAIFAAARQSATPGEMLAEGNEGDEIGALLRDVLGIYCREIFRPSETDVVVASDLGERRPPLHARLTFIDHAEGDRERHFCFRAIGHAVAQAFLPRLRAAMTAAGIDEKLKFRHLFILRSTPEPAGKVTAALVEKFRGEGGKFIAPGEDTLRTFLALRLMQSQQLEGFEAWLRFRKPLCGTAFFRNVGLSPPPLGPVDGRTGSPAANEDGPASPPAAAAGSEAPEATAAPSSAEPALADGVAGGKRTGHPAPAGSDRPVPRLIPVGYRVEGGGLGRLETLSADLLPRHTAIFAGSGSGKTVLLRRLVEEAALLGIPAIVLDTNNDLARLGDAWPERPESFTDDDVEKARRYRADVEVVVWTPNRSGGRPLTLSLLPSFSGLTDADERPQAVAMARETLKPMIGASGQSGTLKEGVLVHALTAFSRSDRAGLDAFIAFLADLPEGVSDVNNAAKLASAMADQLRAKIAINPLLNAAGQSVDPGVLFGASSPGKTRISVINFAALQATDSRADFVNQLQMALFTWIRNHPSPTGRLYVLDEAQNFAPAQSGTACKASAMALSAQARKYGLGMIFATQAPKGIDNKIVSNCTTHFYGRMSAPATIEATKEMMEAKGGAADDLGRLERATFYFATEGLSRPIKVRTPLCLSFHPENPLSADEIAAKARG